jgi:fructokinase
MSTAPLRVFGEVLFDHFPDGSRVLGGAPFNVAWHLQAFGQHPQLITRVGDDAEGRSIVDAMQAWGMRTDGVQLDTALPTGRVSVTFDDGEPEYEIVNPCAYDAIEPGPGDGCRFLYHGSLAARDSRSRASLRQLVDAGPERVFLDVNLRPPWWDIATLHEMLEAADWVKLNGDELDLLHAAGISGDRAREFLDAHGLSGLILTHGAEGAEILTSDGQRQRVAPQPVEQVVDTVGAGDAFASVLILGLLNDWPLAKTQERAQAFASAIVGQRGATVSDRGFYQALAEHWQL